MANTYLDSVTGARIFIHFCQFSLKTREIKAQVQMSL